MNCLYELNASVLHPFEKRYIMSFDPPKSPVSPPSLNGSSKKKSVICGTGILPVSTLRRRSGRKHCAPTVGGVGAYCRCFLQFTLFNRQSVGFLRSLNQSPNDTHGQKTQSFENLSQNSLLFVAIYPHLCTNSNL